MGGEIASEVTLPLRTHAGWWPLTGTWEALHLPTRLSLRKGHLCHARLTAVPTGRAQSQLSENALE